MKLKLIGTLLALTYFSSPAFATEYIYRDLMGNTLPSAKCESLADAKASAVKPYKFKSYSKKFCQTQGYGWHVDEIKDNGEVACNECSDEKGLQKCYVKDITVTCKRIKPGTVGMLPGKG
ncbi:hypothetical protein AU255_16225 [Methyloprofundus sedimenti]|uniref:Uncharacterized protein n=1 Tax=Methyloprofundus sedimenti TaxID=1420851 RepID=A0A1V8M2H1_9GAMM|nr:hypothetical protein [Methyloprofundus sedimenti]OQK15745.1 hypothetical protein AU255_16225 [Methyloprofundus sedimenti]